MQKIHTFPRSWSGPGLPLQSQVLPLSLLSHTGLPSLPPLPQTARHHLSIFCICYSYCEDLSTPSSSFVRLVSFPFSRSSTNWPSLTTLSNIWRPLLTLQSLALCCSRSFTACHYLKLPCLLSLSPTRMKSSWNQEPCLSFRGPDAQRVVSVLPESHMPGKDINGLTF